MSKVSKATSMKQRSEGRIARTDSACWCGQDLDAVRHANCPRCGRRRAVPSRLESVAN
jgi:hypothetical protein